MKLVKEVLQDACGALLCEVSGALIAKLALVIWQYGTIILILAIWR
jgi:hypothetical protein